MAWPLRSYPAGVYQEPAEAICLLIHDGGSIVPPQSYSVVETNLLKPQADTGLSLFKQFLQVILKKAWKRLRVLLPLLKIFSLFN